MSGGVVVLMGLPGSGKSSLLRALPPERQMPVIDRDAIRAAMFPRPFDARSEKDAAISAVWAALAARLKFGQQVVIDGMTFASQRNRDQVARIARPALPAEYYRELSRSLTLARRHGTLVLCLLGEVVNPESVAEMADFFLRLDGCAWSLVGGAFDGTYFVSLRTQLQGGYAYPLLERVLDGRGSFGGHGRVAGGRVPLEGGEVEIHRLESRLRAQALKILANARRREGSTPLGLPLS